MEAQNDRLKNEIANVIIAGSAEDFNEVSTLFQSWGINKRAVGRISENELDEPGLAGPF